MDKKSIFKIKIVMAIFAAIALGLGIYFLIETYAIGQTSYFSKHFLGAICLLCIAVIAFLLPMINSQKLSGDNKGDNIMVVVSFLLIVFSVLTIILSYIM